MASEDTPSHPDTACRGIPYTTTASGASASSRSAQGLAGLVKEERRPRGRHVGFALRQGFHPRTVVPAYAGSRVSTSRTGLVQSWAQHMASARSVKSVDLEVDGANPRLAKADGHPTSMVPSYTSTNQAWS
ncbi:hypothetical protein [Rubrivirga sp.]|uniref:hypothetical protein n=1 Tax=Rubrivirga sp. TaxID=1885344 RepID=UPI003C739A81